MVLKKLSVRVTIFVAYYHLYNLWLNLRIGLIFVCLFLYNHFLSNLLNLFQLNF